jgi:hypothetical protein
MEKKHLIESANTLVKVSERTAEEYQGKSEQFIQKMNELMLARQDLIKLIGENNTQMMKDNHANHVRFIASILKKKNVEILVETLLWVFRAYRSHGFTTNYWAAQLNTWFVVLQDQLSPESYSEVYPYYEWMQVNIPSFVVLSDEKLELSSSMH